MDTVIDKLIMPFRRYKAASESHDSCGTFALYKGQIASEVCQADVWGAIQ